MGKRKREIFTVIEYVPNWFEAHTPTIIKTVEGEGVVNHLGSGSGDTSSTRVYIQSAGGVLTSPTNFLQSTWSLEPRPGIYPLLAIPGW